jgi:branched-chain amino acid transport system ATP-binding protein
MPADGVLLRLAGVRKFFGGLHAVDGVDLDLHRGERRAVIGPNGAGKTTLFNLVTGRLVPDGGSISLAGRVLNGWPPYRICRLGVSRTFQITSIFKRLTVFENVQVSVLAHERRTLNPLARFDRMAREDTASLLDMVGLTGEAHRVSGTLSYGDQKRLELACALANQPTLLLLDEPTAGLPALEKASVMELLLRIAGERDLTLLFTEHDLAVIFGAADSISVLHQGRIIASGSPAAVRANDEVQRVYLGELDG